MIEKKSFSSDERRVTRDEPLRTCIVTGETLSKEGLLRFVASPDGGVVPDLEGKLPGRGLWVKANRAVLEKAVAKNAFSRAAKTKLTVSSDLPVRTQELLEKQVQSWLALGRKASAVIFGAEKVSEGLRAGEVKLLILAEDAKGDAEKILRLAGDVPVIKLLSRDALGQVLARDHAVYMGVLREDFAEKIRSYANRLAGFIENNTL